MVTGKIVINQRTSEKTGKPYRAVWFQQEGHKDRLLSLDWFKFAALFHAFDEVKAGEYPVVLCEVYDG